MVNQVVTVILPIVPDPMNRPRRIMIIAHQPLNIALPAGIDQCADLKQFPAVTIQEDTRAIGVRRHGIGHL